MKKKLIRFIKNLFLFVSLSLAGLSAACAPAHHVVVEDVPVTLQTDVYFYPLNGQSVQQQDRDRYECSLWAVEQSGFDPSIPELASHQRMTVVQSTAGADHAVTGAMAGAMIGAVSGGPRGGFERTIIGALIGGFIGAAADANNQEQIEANYNREKAYETAILESKVSDYRRALQACLSGRGYRVE
jgi:hypothetical protein